MNSTCLLSDSDLHSMRALVQQLSTISSLVDFEEVIQLASIREATRLWWINDRLAGFAYVDDCCNLWFELDPLLTSKELEDKIVDWGLSWMIKQNARTGLANTLDACVQARNTQHLGILEGHGFIRSDMCTIKYSRSLSLPIQEQLVPAGFSIRHVRGEEEVEDLVTLHRAAFGTDQMTNERRLAIMQAPGYDPTLDLLVVSPERELAAFCICSLVAETEPRMGLTDPIGTHPKYQRLGLGKAVVTTGLKELKERGAQLIELGTSSDNPAMQRLAESLGFTIFREDIWLTRKAK
jgi:mycothiol synthase